MVKIIFIEEAFNLFSKQPDLLRGCFSLIASRDKVLDILSLDEDDNMSFHQLDFKKIDKSDIKVYIDFIDQAGLLYFLQKEASRSLVDYVYGVEAGLDSNARKIEVERLWKASLNEVLLKFVSSMI